MKYFGTAENENKGLIMVFVRSDDVSACQLEGQVMTVRVFYMNQIHTDMKITIMIVMVKILSLWKTDVKKRSLPTSLSCRCKCILSGTVWEFLLLRKPIFRCTCRCGRLP